MPWVLLNRSLVAGLYCPSATACVAAHAKVRFEGKAR